MLFASDLDRTLIYSKQFLPNNEEQLILPVETKEDQPISYMTETAIRLLRKLTEDVLFVPVTTRTIEQYKRIFFITNEIQPKYAIVSNGGNLLVEGEIDETWKKKIQSQLTRECIGIAEVLERFKEIQSEQWIINHRVADELFSYCVVEKDKIPYDELRDFQEWLGKNNWNTSLQGRKLYFVPQCISKGAAIAYIQEKEGYQFMTAAGDSLLDLPMLEMADYALCPPHGELNRFISEGLEINGNIEITKKEGIFAAEEILEKAEQLLQKDAVSFD